jgi:SPP1 gp7 family putative phage head morphogenesis protein
VLDADPDVDGFDKAVAWFRERVPLTSAEWAKLTEEAQARAFTVANVAQLDVVADVWRALDEAIAGGTTFADFKAAVGDKLAAEWGGEDATRLETIFRTNVQLAYNAGRYDQQTDPAVLEARPFWRYSAVLDSRTSRICGPLHGTTLPADHSWWSHHQPPLHFNCRSTIVSLTPDQAQSFGIATDAPDVEPQDGFGKPGMPPYQPDLSDRPAALASAYEAKNR